MTKKYFCDHCKSEIHHSNKITITTTNKRGGFDVVKGQTTDEFFISFRNFDRLDYCNVDHMTRGITNNKYKAIEIDGT